MANRAFLFSTPSSDFDASTEIEPHILCGASNMMPLFWYSLLDSSSIRRLPLQGAEEDFPDGFTHLVTDKAAGLARSRARRDALTYLIGGRSDEWHALFMGFVEREASAYLHFWVYELWDLHGNGEFDDQVSVCLSAFDLPQYETNGWLRKSRTMTKPWRTLLSQAQISPTNVIGTLEAYKCCGYRWLHPVPWEQGI